MMECDLEFAASASSDEGSFKLLELPQDLVQLISSSLETSNPARLAIKGLPGEDDAVLTTNDTTYSMRSIVLSNTVLIVVPPVDGDFADDRAVIRDQVNEIIELAPVVPKLHKLTTLLRGREYTENEENIDEDEPTGGLTYAEAQGIIQASDAELDRGLKEKRVLNINGELRMISPDYLQNILELVLALLVSQSRSLDAVPIEPLVVTLADEHEIPRAVSTQIMSWFGSIQQDRWKSDIESILKEIGLAILRPYKENTVTAAQFLAKWKETVGESFETRVSLDLLVGNYLVKDSSTAESQELNYFPASALPIDPAARFGDLFLTRSRWKNEDITPFLADIAVNSKERDKLLLKYTRTVTDAKGVWYTARAQYYG